MYKKINIFGIDMKKLISAFAYLMLFTCAFAQSHSLTVTNGGGDGSYSINDIVPISADAPAAGHHFLKWTTPDGGSFADEYSSYTTYSMPGNTATITANFSTYTSFTSTAEKKLTASDAASTDEFGFCVDVYGDTAVVGAWRDDDNGNDSGSVYVFVKSGEIWSQQQKLTPDDGAAMDYFGKSVSIYGDTIVVGANSDDDGGPNSGSIYVFTRSGTTWTQQAKLTASDPQPLGYFGTSVSISGNTIVSGAPEKGASGGNVYVFTGSGANWTEQAILTASDAQPNEAFGNAVSISGDTIIIGAHGDDDAGPSSGSAYIFVGSGASWTQQAKLTASDAAKFDSFGFSVDISGDTVVVGARFDDDDGLSSGSAYIFTRSGTSWSQQAKLTASDAAENDSFGQSVSVSGDRVVIGAYSNDDAGNNSGSAYAFLRNGSSWSQKLKLTAQDAAESDSFGYSVAIHGQNAVIGSVFDSGGGSAYTYDLIPAHKLTVTNGSGDGVYKPEEAVPVVADAPPAGFSFVNWTTTDGGLFTDENSSITTYTMPGNPATITANYVVNTYTVTFDKQGGTGGSNSVIATYNSVMPAATVPTRTDYRFAGYFTAPYGGGVQFYSSEMASTNNWSLANNTTLYAKWIVNTFIVTYDGNENTGGTAPANQKKTYDVDLILSTAGSLVKAGNTFGGWNNSDDGSGANYVGGSTYTSNQNTTLYANWIPDTYIVSYNGNGNTGGTVPQDQTKTHDVDLILSNAGSLVKAGYTFTGWNTTQNGSGTVYSAGATYTGNSALNLYAQWTHLGTTHDADTNNDWSISQTEVESFINAYNSNNNSVSTTNGDITANRITMREVLRVIYLYNGGGNYIENQQSVDGYNIEQVAQTASSEPANIGAMASNEAPGAPGNDTGNKQPGKIVVSSNSDSGIDSLRNAIAFAADGDTITIDPSLDTIVVLAEIVIDKSITIDGQGVAIVSGDNKTRIFRIQNNDKSINVTLKNMGIVDAENKSDGFGGAIYNKGQTLNLNTVLFDGNTNTAKNGKGGAVYNSGTLNVGNCIFQNNSASVENDIYSE